MRSAAVVCLLGLGGAGLVVQNLAMLRVRSASGSTWGALWVNSAFGLVVLSVIVVVTGELAPVARSVVGLGWWALVPGVMGTVFVLASLTGYAFVGAGMTIAVLVCAQLLAGVAVDSWRNGAPSGSAVVGSALLCIGVALIVSGGSNG